MPVGKGDEPGARQMRRLFFIALAQQLRIIWPILSGIVSVMIVSGLAIWRIENWRIDEALYFTFVTGLTIGYGDFTPKHLSARMFALVIGFAGIVLTGVVAAVTVKALSATDQDSRNGRYQPDEP
ncbi:two pore domain potassium channel family protein [Rhizobium sp. NZLR1]|nr:two pore domain potassium channel family protein [Rhizobium sp. NZLR8]MBX5162006.1 two pore domain potassium channel family protein [Rhizobium sp. NZLR4b]MBX5181160.1 two pore domain potassium channel family protein [Rhizobium sp. NZLR5]MBX5188065.1 two pore domain potassium channel family protein [Rhizobium sp. NZLR3b]MBX5197695.1 two pore domain potassium channel family protein [Rhizobium sp. NZLR10]MBX5200531.1 two pore domain potassium channel family protein [Rhizobium sp. NZLR1]MBX520